MAIGDDSPRFLPLASSANLNDGFAEMCTNESSGTAAAGIAIARLSENGNRTIPANAVLNFPMKSRRDGWDALLIVACLFDRIDRLEWICDGCSRTFYIS